MSETIPHWLTKQAELSPGKTAIECEDGSLISFRELKNRSQHFARKIASVGVTADSRVGILSANHVDMVIAIHAISYLGAVAVMLNMRLTARELNYQIQDAGVETVLVKEQGPTLDVPVYSFSEIKKLDETEITLRNELKLDDLFTIIYTSGTTGFPKGVMHTYGNHWWSAVGSMLNFGLNSEDKWLAVLPIFHVGGLSIFLRSVIYGIPAYLMETFDERKVHEAIMTKHVTIASVVTVMLKRLVNVLEDASYPASFRSMLLGGGSAPKSLLEKAKEHRIPVFQSYGMTETSSQIVTLSPDNALDKLGSSGKPLFPARLKIVAADNGVGEIFVKGPMVTNGYYNNSDATQNSFHDGWLSTGDLGYVDEDGFLFVVDRRKDLIISGGENIYPSEIESVLAMLESIQEAAVVGKESEEWGQVPIAFVVKKDEITKEKILEYAQQHLAKYKLPRKIIFVDQLPRNASNKIVRGKLSEFLVD
ncbi:o-succinylbenzoate--CoA ligase [Virgibacillus siamensis]|uniref:o-succinylbenzoate--CoA ligase n=1 Tax=Virgibacillus siamensis TaxID=480071 RepID=UPI0009879860|nr:o-succinylbenzoate--CoA ligase [Virgibacillus siamensis]